jgi:hypothetical protein
MARRLSGRHKPRTWLMSWLSRFGLFEAADVAIGECESLDAFGADV